MWRPPTHDLVFDAVTLRVERSTELLVFGRKDAEDRPLLEDPLCQVVDEIRVAVVASAPEDPVSRVDTATTDKRT